MSAPTNVANSPHALQIHEIKIHEQPSSEVKETAESRNFRIRWYKCPSILFSTCAVTTLSLLILSQNWPTGSCEKMLDERLFSCFDASCQGMYVQKCQNEFSYITHMSNYLLIPASFVVLTHIKVSDVVYRLKRFSEQPSCCAIVTCGMGALASLANLISYSVLSGQAPCVDKTDPVCNIPSPILSLNCTSIPSDYLLAYQICDTSDSINANIKNRFPYVLHGMLAFISFVGTRALTNGEFIRSRPPGA